MLALSTQYFKSANVFAMLVAFDRLKVSVKDFNMKSTLLGWICVVSTVSMLTLPDTR